MYKYDDYVEMVGSLVEDETLLKPDSSRVEKAIKLSIATFSMHTKNTLVKEIDATSGRSYPIPEGWDNEFSDAGFKIQYPVDDNADQIQFLRLGMYELYDVPVTESNPRGKMIRFRTTTNSDLLPSAGQKFRVHIGVRYKVTADEVTLPDSFFAAFCYLTSSTLCLMLQVKYGQRLNPIGGGSGDIFGNGQNQSSTFAKAAQSFFERYENLIIPAKGALAPAMSFGEFVDDPMHREARTMFPRDYSDRNNTDI